MNETLTYLKSFFKDKDVASVTPTSRFCVEHVCRPINFSSDLTIVEYGAGAGVFAEYLTDKITSDSKLIMFETNERLFSELQKRAEDDPRLHCYMESVEFVDTVLPKAVVRNVDIIISGIPFSFLEDKTANELLEKSRKILRPVGQFLAYQTSGHLEKPLRRIFGNVHTEWEWRNIPPMTVYKAVKE
jgi:phospholipid N-methyltransferase